MGREISIPGDEVREFNFKVYFHRERLTVEPELGIYFVPVFMRLWKAQRGKSKDTVTPWHLERLDIPDAFRPVFKAQRRRVRCDFDIAALILKAMMVLHGEGINPILVRGWGKTWGQSGAAARATERFLDWVNAEVGDVAAD